MGRILYIFPHPDDESFGPGPLMAKQRRQGHAVYLLTLTRGEATSQRAKYGYTKDEMGAVRVREMEAVAQTLDLTDLTVLDFPDGGLAAMDPRLLEAAVAAHLAQVQPHVVVTYAVHGNSGHPDHLVGHAVVKRVFCEHREAGGALQRLALFTLPAEDPTGHRPAHLKGSPPEDIQCIARFEDEDRARGEAALDCYETYRAVVEEHQPLEQVADGVCFILFGEAYRPPLDDLFAGLDLSAERAA